MLWQRASTERLRRHHLNAVCALVIQQAILNPAPIHSVDQLVNLRSRTYPDALFRLAPHCQLVDVEIADTDLAHEPSLQQLVESAHRPFQRQRSSRMQEVEVQGFAAQALDR